MASSDLDVLVDMGFDKERADMAVKKTGGRKFAYIHLILVIKTPFTDFNQ